ncbi:Putative aspartate kinase [Candidatus Phycorickettsia trachydisci]|uniref:Aspartokinase n=1 Tax=Candidatus Phycorickettsia trachydisci TaxID=2115978 RepID=A0A2P1P7Y0_9RICK|nr:aspartate kinase [Candidatus Phycorickettsia trachydisci]AVP87374.1 Putative aspartate kinase [Candidatus Phycorickettsia trachydisci]
MGIIVQKFGGTSVSNIERIKQIVPKIQKEINRGHYVAVVISAMAGFTNSLVEYCKAISSLINTQEKAIVDFVLSNGENISCGLMSLALNNNGIKSIPLQGWQIPITTDNQNTSALILNINHKIILEYLNQGFVPVICGFQGINNNNITTLGRGGSDITAVAVAASISAERCDIYTDVSGIYSADPRIIHNAYKISKIDHNTMLEFSYQGAKVMHPRSIEIAKTFGINLNVLSSFEEEIGTQIVANKHMEQSKIIGIVCNPNIFMVEIESTKPLHKILLELKAEVLSAFNSGKIIKIICSMEEMNKIEQILEKNYDMFTIRSDVAIVSVIGNRLLNEKSLINKILKVISDFEISYFNPEHSRISMLLNEEDAQNLTQKLHKEFIEDNH